MLHACVQRFDVTENLEKFSKILETKQALMASSTYSYSKNAHGSVKHRGYVPSRSIRYYTDLVANWGNLGQVNCVDFEAHTVHDTWQESLKFSFFTSPSLLGRAAEHWCTCK